jgi:hypothetical protein
MKNLECNLECTRVAQLFRVTATFETTKTRSDVLDGRCTFVEKNASNYQTQKFAMEGIQLFSAFLLQEEKFSFEFVSKNCQCNAVIRARRIGVRTYPDRATRLGKFSPIGNCFLLGGQFFLITEGALCTTSIPRIKLFINFEKTAWALQFGRFFTNSSGHSVPRRSCVELLQY